MRIEELLKYQREFPNIFNNEELTAKIETELLTFFNTLTQEIAKTFGEKAIDQDTHILASLPRVRKNIYLVEGQTTVYEEAAGDLLEKIKELFPDQADDVIKLMMRCYTVM